jgi:hypothetical protein
MIPLLHTISRLSAWRKVNGQSGQMLIVIGLVVIPISMVLAAVAVDASVWQSERRGAQKDADLGALAGALELVGPSGSAANASATAAAYLAQNDEAGNGGSKAPNIHTLTVDDTCFHTKNADGTPRSDAVTVDLLHESRTFFASIFGIDAAPDIGAHAKACAGAAQAPQGIVPIETDLTGPCFGVGGVPLIAQPCPLDFGAQDGNPRGILDLQADPDYCSQGGGSGDLTDLIVNGATGTCLINSNNPACPGSKWYDCVAVQPGNPTRVGRAFRARLAKDGQCDALYGNPPDGTDDFNETVSLAFGDPNDPATAIYEPRDCDPNTDGVQMSPRLITIIVLKTPPVANGSTGNPIYAFAGIYVSGCNSDPNTDMPIYKDCENINGGGNVEIAPVGGGTHFTSLNMADCGSGAKKTPCPTDTPVPTNTPTFTRTPTYTSTSTRTPTPTFTPGPPTNTPTPGNSGPCGHGNQPTCVPTPTPGGPTATPTPDNGGGGNGHIVVWGRLVNLIFAGSEAGPPTNATTIFSISLTQ